MKFLLNITFISFIFSMLFVACKSKQFDNKNYKESESYVSVGQFGGFTNLKQETIILKNGQVFKLKAFSKEYSEAPKVKKRKIRNVINALHKVKIDPNFKNEPGNLTYFINYNLCGKKHSIKWGKNGKEAPAFIAEAYQKIMDLTSMDEESSVK